MPAKKSAALEALGDTIRSARRERGYAQEAFAARVGLDRSYFGAIERGEFNVTLGYPVEDHGWARSTRKHAASPRAALSTRSATSQAWTWRLRLLGFGTDNQHLIAIVARLERSVVLESPSLFIGVAGLVVLGVHVNADNEVVGAVLVKQNLEHIGEQLRADPLALMVGHNSHPPDFPDGHLIDVLVFRK
jgi:hypothetical protein